MKQEERGDECVDQKISGLSQQIIQFHECENLEEKGVMMNTCYRLLNALMEEMKAKKRKWSYSKQTAILKLRQQLQKYQDEYLQRVSFMMLVQDSIRLQALVENDLGREQDKVFELAALIKKDKERVRFEQLTFRDKKIFEDISQLLVNVEAMKVLKNKKGSGSKKILQSTYQSGAMSTLQDEQIVKEIMEHNNEENLLEIGKEMLEIHKVNKAICSQINLQGEGINLILENEKKLDESTDQAHRDYLEAQQLEFQTRRIQIRAYFTGLFGFLGYLKGFGTALGGFFGWVVGGAVAKASQTGLEEKSGGEEQKKQE